MLASLILAQVAAAFGWWLFTAYEIRANVALILADGSKDSLHEAFHAGRTRRRAAWAVGLALVGSLPVIGVAGPRPVTTLAVLALGLLCLFVGWFTYRFSPELNVYRGKPENYVSAEPHAAWFDRTLARRGWGLLPVVRAVLLAGVVLYLLALAAGIYLHHH